MSFFKKEFYLFEPKKISLGLDIGDSIIRMAVLRHTPRETQLLKLGSVELASKEAKEKQALLAEAITRLLKENNIKAKDVYTNLPWEALEVRIISIPSVPEEELRQGLQYEAQPHFSFPLEKAEFDYMVIEEVSGAEGRRLEIVVAACPKEIVEERLRLFQGLGLKVRLLGLAPLALWNSFKITEPENKSAVVALLHLKDSQANLSIFMKGKLRFVRDISLTKPLSELSFTSIEELSAEIRRSFDYYKAQSRVDKIDRLVFSGEGIKFANLDRLLTERLGVLTEKANPLKNIRLNGLDYSQEIVPAFTAAIGLGLAGQGEKALNLLPASLIKERRFIHQALIMKFAAGFLVLLISLMQFQVLARERAICRERNELTARVNEFRKIYNDVSIFESDRKKMEARLAFIKNQMKEQRLWPELFKDISEVIPEGLWLNSLQSSSNQKKDFLELNGYGFSNQAAVEFTGGLKGIPYFDEVKLNFIRAQEISQKKVIGFEIICQLKEAE